MDALLSSAQMAERVSRTLDRDGMAGRAGALISGREMARRLSIVRHTGGGAYDRAGHGRAAAAAQGAVPGEH